MMCIWISVLSASPTALIWLGTTPAGLVNGTLMATAAKPTFAAERRLRFRYFEGAECVHGYNNSAYYINDDPTKYTYDGYDVFPQTDSAIRFMQQQRQAPFSLTLSLGPPHFPLHSAPQKYQDLYDPATIALRPNVDENCQADEVGVREDTAGYYAHCTAIDDAIGQIIAFLDESGLADNTIVVFSSDHGDMMYSHGMIHKQKPFDESILVPLLIRPPRQWRTAGHCQPSVINEPIGLLDYLPTFAGLCDVPYPTVAQGTDYSAAIRETGQLPVNDQFIAGYGCFGEYERGRGGREWRGVRTARYTYARDLNSDWMLFDNEADPYQQHNMVDSQPELVAEMSAKLDALLARFDDPFPPKRSCWNAGAGGLMNVARCHFPKTAVLAPPLTAAQALAFPASTGNNVSLSHDRFLRR